MPEALDSAAHIPAQAAAAAGYVGVLRYLGFAGDGRRLDRAELDAYFEAGLAVALIREENGRELLGGTDAGHRLGQHASQLADELGWPHDRPVYLTQDTGFARSQWGAVRDAIGTAGTYRPLSFYGGGDLGDWLVDQGVIPSFWLAGAFSWTSTWSGRRWDPNADPIPQIPATRHAVIAQTPEQPAAGGVTCDRNIILGPDWGQYHPDHPIAPLEDDVPLTDAEIDRIAASSAQKVMEILTGRAQAQGQDWAFIDGAGHGQPYPKLDEIVGAINLGSAAVGVKVIDSLKAGGTPDAVATAPVDKLAERLKG